VPDDVFQKCPKCGYARASGETASPESCPSCGLIFAKYLAAQSGAPPRAAAVRDPAPLDAEERSSLLERLLYVPARVDRISFYGRAAAYVLFFVWGWQLYAKDIATAEINGSFIHNVILTVHEAGHVLFIPLGRFMTVLGGSLFQVLMPLILMGAFILGMGGSRRDNFAASLMLWWAAVAIIDVAPYIWDAFDPKMMLLGGGTGAESDGHDWQNILGDLGLIKRAHLIAGIAHKLGLALLLTAYAWGAALLYRQFGNRGSVVFEDEA
jgi:hypothetical protein